MKVSFLGFRVKPLPQPKTAILNSLLRFKCKMMVYEEFPKVCMTDVNLNRIERFCEKKNYLFKLMWVPLPKHRQSQKHVIAHNETLDIFVIAKLCVISQIINK